MDVKVGSGASGSRPTAGRGQMAPGTAASEWTAAKQGSGREPPWGLPWGCVPSPRGRWPAAGQPALLLHHPLRTPDHPVTPSTLGWSGILGVVDKEASLN